MRCGDWLRSGALALAAAHPRRTVSCLIVVAVVSLPTHARAQSMPSRATAAVSWGSVPTEKASVANVAPALLPYFNNGPVFGLPGTEVGDFRHGTQLSGDWGGIRTDLA